MKTSSSFNHKINHKMGSLLLVLDGITWLSVVLFMNKAR